MIHQGAHLAFQKMNMIRDGPFDIQVGLGFFLEKIVCFPSEKNKMCSMKLKIKSLFSFGEAFRSPFLWELLRFANNTEFNMYSLKYVDLLLASSVLKVNYKIKKINNNICKD